MPRATAKKVYRDTDFYTGRSVVITRGGKEVAGKVGTGFQCGSGNFSFYTPPTADNPYGDDSCESRSRIVRFGK